MLDPHEMDQYYYDENHGVDCHWLICVNCEYEMSIDDYFFDLDEDILSDMEIECPVCKSREMRKADF